LRAALMETDLRTVASTEACLHQNLADFDVILVDEALGRRECRLLRKALPARTDAQIVMLSAGNGSAADAACTLEAVGGMGGVVSRGAQMRGLREENRWLHQELDRTVGELQLKNEQLKAALREQQKLAITDELTGVSNRRHFLTMLDRYYEQSVRYDFDLTCCMCDLDSYKDFNDTHGHQAGDCLLAALAQIMRSTLRSSDVVARYGGDEFVLLLPHTSADRARQVGQRIRRLLVEQCCAFRPAGPVVSVSMGVASRVSDRPASADELILLADRALYQAKRLGKDRVVWFGDVRAALAQG